VTEELSNHNSKIKYNCPQTFLVAIFLLSSASLSYEINFTRLFSVTQFYHFAFLIVSLAMLGFGTSGAVLALLPKTFRKDIGFLLTIISFLTAISFLSAYLLTNYLPFDSFSIALGWKPIGVLLIQMISLTIPFFFSGLAVVLLISRFSKQANLIYAINLAGSAFGCLFTLLLSRAFGAVGLVVLCTLFAITACLLLFIRKNKFHINPPKFVHVIKIVIPLFILFSLIDLFLRIYSGSSLEFMKLNVSPYKGISYALQYPDAEIIFQEWNAFSRVDLIRSGGIRSLPGYSYLSKTLPPEQDGLFIDGDDLSVVIRGNEFRNVSTYMPTTVAYILRPAADVLILEPRGGLEIVIAHSEGAKTIVTAEPNSLIVEAAHNIYTQDYLVNHLESGRSHLRRSHDQYDVIVISLNSSFRPVRSGAYSLGEDYRYTVESIEEAILRLENNGVLILTRWLQTPPSEFLRTFGIAIEAIEKMGGNAAQKIAAFRSYNTGTLIINRSNFTPSEINLINDFTSQRAFDLVYYPGIKEENVNKYNILPEPYYYQAFTSLIFSDSRDEWYREYPYDVKPPTDDQPFFNQYFKWSQLPLIIAEFGRVWEPFGGAGFVILLLLLILTIILSLSFVFIPTIISVKAQYFEKSHTGKLMYFAAIGLAFMFVEIPMIQHFILFLDNPSYSLTTVLFTLLLFSGIGSRFSKLISINTVFICILVIGTLNLLFLRQAVYFGLGFPLILRILLSVLLLAPIGFFMGMPFPKGIEIIVNMRSELVPWAWGINGTFSVVAGVGAALIAISYGFRAVFIVGSILYMVAWILIRVPAPDFQDHRQ
jgi:hypothetical protein